MSMVSPFCIRYMKGTWWDQAKYQETESRKSGNPITQDKELWSQTTSEVSSTTLLTSAPDFLYGHLRVCCLSTSILALGSPPSLHFQRILFLSHRIMLKEGKFLQELKSNHLYGPQAILTSSSLLSLVELSSICLLRPSICICTTHLSTRSHHILSCVHMCLKCISLFKLCNQSIRNFFKSYSHQLF